MLGSWRRRGEKRCAAKQNETYRMADPRDIVEAEGTAMSGPGGTPQVESTPDERPDA